MLKNGVEALAVLFNAGLLGYELLATPPNLRATSDKVVLGVNAAALIAGGIPTIANLASCLKAEYDGHKAVAAQFNPGRAIGALNAGLKAIEGGCAIARGASKFKKGSYVGGFLTTASGLGSLVSGLFQIGKQIVSKTKLAKKSA